MKNRNKNDIYDEYMPQNAIQRGIQQSKLFCGTLTVNASKRKIAYVHSDDISIDVHVDEEYRNRSIHGDKVVVALLPEINWIASPSSPIQPGSSGVNESTRTVEQLEYIIKMLKFQPKGRVVGIIESSHKVSHCGVLAPTGNLVVGKPLTANYVVFRPTDIRIPHLRVNRLELPDAFVADPLGQSNNIFIANIGEWPSSSQMCEGVKVRSLGEVGSIHAETEALLLENNVNHGAFTDEMLLPLHELLLSQGVLGNCYTSNFTSTAKNSGSNEGSEVKWSIPEEEISRRKDLRRERIFSIDPPSARDLDDALSITLLPDGHFSIGVHIADVSHFVKYGSALDREAQRRATSVYLVQKVIPMLPSILCEQLCSLNPGVDRLAFSCVFTLDSEGNLTDKEPWFGKTVVRSCSKMDYPTAQRIIDGAIPATNGGNADQSEEDIDVAEEMWEFSRRPSDGHKMKECANDVLQLHILAQKRRSLRLQSGAFILTNPKLSFTLDKDGNPTDVKSYTISHSNNLVEEFMLAANYLAARRLLATCGRAAFLRRHPAPKIDRLEELTDFTRAAGVEFDVSSSRALQQSLARVSTECDVITVQCISSLLMHSMNLAVYCVAKSHEFPDWKHYALAMPYYTHFTSPIRRYADVVVHRLLELSLTDLTMAQSLDESEEILNQLKVTASHCNTMRMNAKTAQERSDHVFLAILLRNEPQDRDAVVIGVGAKSFSVSVLGWGIEQRIFVDNIEGVTSCFDPSTQVLTLFRPTSPSSSNVRKHHNSHSTVPKQDIEEPTFPPPGSTILSTIRMSAKVPVRLSAETDKSLIQVSVTLIVR